MDGMTEPTTDPQYEMVVVEARVPLELWAAALRATGYATESEVIRRGLSCLAGVEQPPVKLGRHERQASP